MENPEFDYKVNAVGSQNVFEAAAFEGAKVIFASSAAVYGAKSPASEADEHNPISIYGKSKAEAEKYCPEDAFIARLFNVCGPRGRGVINIFCEAIKSGKEVRITGNGQQTRDFVYVDDVVSALMMGLKEENSGTFNVATGKSIAVIDALHIIENVAEKKAKIEFVPQGEGEIMHSTANISKIRRLGWKPKLSCEDAIKETARAIFS